ncbi:MAG TPA: hypothetical protein VFL28_01285 [bacterium]|nr:hypothetical protein [bacterium]
MAHVVGPLRAAAGRAGSENRDEDGGARHHDDLLSNRDERGGGHDGLNDRHSNVSVDLDKFAVVGEHVDLHIHHDRVRADGRRLGLPHVDSGRTVEHGDLVDHECDDGDTERNRRARERINRRVSDGDDDLHSGRAKLWRERVIYQHGHRIFIHHDVLDDERTHDPAGRAICLDGCLR